MEPSDQLVESQPTANAWQACRQENQQLKRELDVRINLGILAAGVILAASLIVLWVLDMGGADWERFQRLAPITAAIGGFIALVFLGLRSTAAERQAKAALINSEIALEKIKIETEGQLVTRLVEAIELLGSEKESVRIGGIYALLRLAKDSEKDLTTVTSLLCAFSRAESSLQESRSLGSSLDKNPRRQYRKPRQSRTFRTPTLAPRNPRTPSTTKRDVQSAIDVLFRSGAIAPHEALGHNIAAQQTTLPEDSIQAISAFLAGKEEGLNLTNAQLRNLDLSGASMTMVNLSGSDLTGTDFNRARIVGGNFSHTELTGADLRHAFFLQVDFRAASFRKTKLGSEALRDALLSPKISNPSPYSLFSMDLRKADLRGVNLEDVDMRGRDLRGVDFEEAAFARAKLDFADLEGADLGHTHLGAASLESSVLKDCDLIEAKLNNSRLAGADLRRVDFSGADLRNADLSHVAREAEEENWIEGATFYATELTWATLDGHNLENVNFLETADLVGASLRRVSLAGVSLAGTNLDEADLSWANLSNADLRGTTFNQTDLNGATLAGARIGATDLRGALHLTQEQIDLALGNSETQLPGHILAPAHWLE